MNNPDRLFDLDAEPPAGGVDGDTVVPLSRQARDAATPEGVKKQTAQKEAAFEGEARFWRTALKSVDGRKALFKFLDEQCQVFADPFQLTPVGFPDDKATFFRMGGQRVGRNLLDMLEIIDREAVWLMRSEHDPKYQALPKAE